MCLGSSPTITPPAPAAPPPAPPAPVVDVTPVETAVDSARTSDKKAKGRDALRIDLASSNQGGASGLNIPV